MQRNNYNSLKRAILKISLSQQSTILGQRNGMPELDRTQFMCFVIHHVVWLMNYHPQFIDAYNCYSVCACNVLHCSIYEMCASYPKIIPTRSCSVYFKMNAIECRNNASTTNWLAMKLLWFRSAIIWADRFVFRIKCVICMEYVLGTRIEFDRFNAQWCELCSIRSSIISYGVPCGISARNTFEKKKHRKWKEKQFTKDTHVKELKTCS